MTREPENDFSIFLNTLEVFMKKQRINSSHSNIMHMHNVALNHLHSFNFSRKKEMSAIKFFVNYAAKEYFS